ncbi:MAG: BolA family transcriptional regulator [Cyanobacteria bacterium M5B4]|nr:MAG: BolA family transcriptional regulator [Cyanobacteria bacterium M5B4]
MVSAAQITTLIKEAIPGAQVRVEDPYNDGQHFTAIVIAEQFAGQTMIKQHRLVNDALKSYLDDGSIHALQLKTYSPEQWQQAQVQVI